MLALLPLVSRTDGADEPQARQQRLAVGPELSRQGDADAHGAASAGAGARAAPAAAVGAPGAGADQEEARAGLHREGEAAEVEDAGRLK